MIHGAGVRSKPSNMAILVAMRARKLIVAALLVVPTACDRVPTDAITPETPAGVDRTTSTSSPVDGPTCLGRVATIVGTAGDDVLDGTSGRDVIVGLAGDDVIRGQGSNDVICGGGGADTIDGGKGDDRLAGGKGDDTIKGKTGRDRILGGMGDDTLLGHRGDDRIRQGDHQGDDQLDGGPGNDTLVDRRGSNTINGGEGEDFLWGKGLLAGEAGPDRLLLSKEAAGYGGEGRDHVIIRARAKSAHGGPAQDIISFAPGSFPRGIKARIGGGLVQRGTWVMTFSGFERHYGTDGPDIFFGSNLNDWIAGGKGRDTVNGQAGTDVCRGFETVTNCEK